MLSSAQLTAMRSAADDSLPDTATITRVTTVTDNMGGLTETWGTLSTASVRVDPASSAQMSQFADRIRNRSVFTVSLAYATDIAAGDRVTVGSVTYEVLGLLQVSWEILRQVLVATL